MVVVLPLFTLKKGKTGFRFYPKSWLVAVARGREAAPSSPAPKSLPCSTFLCSSGQGGQSCGGCRLLPPALPSLASCGAAPHASDSPFPLEPWARGGCASPGKKNNSLQHIPPET